MPHKSLENCFVAVGDIMLGDSAICVGFGFHSLYKRDLRPAFARVAPLLQRGEVVLGNLECLLARAGRGHTRFRADQMRGDPEYADALRSLGFTAIGVANNHAMQHGIQAFEETVALLEDAGVACVGLRGKDGWCSTPVVQTTRAGLRVGLLGYSWRPRQYDYATPPYAEGGTEEVEEDVRRLGKLADAVAVSLHWGEEFLSSPSTGEVDAARRIIDAGATIVVGHHPHVLRPVERYDKGVICYSLGNFATDMLWQPELRRGAIIECRLDRGRVPEPRLWSTRVDDTYTLMVDAVNMPLQEEPVRGIEETAYRVAAAASVRRQRRAAYQYAIRNLRHYPPKVLAELVSATFRNKAAAAVSRVIPRQRRSATANAARSANSDHAGPLSILHVLAPAHFGGLESVVRELAAGHVRRGHTVRAALVLSPTDEPHPLVAGFEEDGVTAIPVYVANRNYRGERQAIRALCRQHRPDIVHTHGYRSDVVDGIVARSEGIAVVSTCHGFIESDWRGRFHQWLQRRALRRFDAVVAVSRAIERVLLEAGVIPTRIHLVLNAATAGTRAVSREEARRLLELPDTSVIGWVGRLSAEKGPDVALEAFARLDQPSVHLLFLGNGRETTHLHAHAKALGISDRVIWRDAVPNAGKLFRAFDAFLISSRTEGTPMSLLEAMAANVPVVATRVGGIPDVVDSSSAHLVESGDVNGLAAALDEVLRNPGPSRAMAERARKRLNEGFAVEPWLSMYESIYRGLAHSA